MASGSRRWVLQHRLANVSSEKLTRNKIAKPVSQFWFLPSAHKGIIVTWGWIDEAKRLARKSRGRVRLEASTNISAHVNLLSFDADKRCSVFPLGSPGRPHMRVRRRRVALEPLPQRQLVDGVGEPHL